MDADKIFSKVYISNLTCLLFPFYPSCLLFCLPSSQEQYKFVYEVALEYLSSF